MPERKTLSALRKEAEKRNESLDGGTVWRALDFVLYLIMIVMIMASIRAVLIDPVRVDGSSMLDTLENGEVMIVNRMSFAFTSPKRGDIILCYYPDVYYEEQGLKYATRVKRVVAVGGDTIETVDGDLYVNGEKVDEPYLTEDRIGNQYIRKQTIPTDSVYVLGDNRTVSRDSRYNTVGPIPLSRVVGKVRLVLFPFDHFRLI